MNFPLKSILRDACLCPPLAMPASDSQDLSEGAETVHPTSSGATLVYSSDDSDTEVST